MMKNEITCFVIGYIAGLVSVLAFLLGRKWNKSYMGGIQRDSERIDECAATVDSITEGIRKTESGIERSIEILRNAKERAESKDSNV